MGDREDLPWAVPALLLRARCHTGPRPLLCKRHVGRLGGKWRAARRGVDVATQDSQGDGPRNSQKLGEAGHTSWALHICTAACCSLGFLPSVHTRILIKVPTMCLLLKQELSGPGPRPARTGLSPRPQADVFTSPWSPATGAGHAPTSFCTQVPTSQWVWAKAPALGGSEPSVRSFPTRTQSCKLKGI